MNKPELVAALALRLGRPKAEATRIIEALFGENGVIGTELRRGRRVQISGFGRFEARKRKARTGRNPQTGRAISIKASVAPVFRAGQTLKQSLNRR